MTSIGLRYVLASQTRQRWISGSSKILSSISQHRTGSSLIPPRSAISNFHTTSIDRNELSNNAADRSGNDSSQAAVMMKPKSKWRRRRKSKNKSTGLAAQLSAAVSEGTEKASSDIIGGKNKSRRRRRKPSKNTSRFSERDSSGQSLKKQSEEMEEVGFESIWKKIVQSVAEQTDVESKQKDVQTKKANRTTTLSKQEDKKAKQLATNVEQAKQVLQQLQTLKSSLPSSDGLTNNEKGKGRYLWSDNKFVNPISPSDGNHSSAPTSSGRKTYSPFGSKLLHRPTTFLKGEEAEKLRVAKPSEDLVEGRNDFTSYLPIHLIPKPDSPEYEAWQKEKRWKVAVGGQLSSNEIEIEEVEPLREMEVPQLSHGLDRVLFNSGVHWLRDDRSGIYNFNPEIRNLYDVDLFDYSALPPYLTSSIDEELAHLTQKHGKRYSGSTSSLTSLLSHIYFCISSWKVPPLTGFTEGFQGLPKGFSFGAKLPAAIVLKRFEYDDGEKKGVRYAVDNDKSIEGKKDNNYVLTQLGKSVEKLLTSSTEEYKNYLRINSHTLSEEEKTKKEAYYYSMSDKFMMRSQLDCSDDRLPRKTFDLKTRAVIAVRQDRANCVESSGYMIRHNTGVYESFERELWDMSRGALLKYYFQARIGNMDGILVAYHSTSTVFGFQYLSREELAERIFSSEEMGEQAFRLSIGMLERILDSATSFYPNDTLRITMDAQSVEENGDESYLQVFITPERHQVETDTEVKSTSDESRSSLLLEVHVDRYLTDALVSGPIDFAEPKGYKIDVQKDDEIERRRRSELPPLEWKLEYSIVPRTDLSVEDTEFRLDKVHQRRSSVAPLLMPNVEALNERELDRQKELAKNPQALEKFLEDRRTGKAPGMPPAPGQIVLGVTDDMHQHVEDAVKLMEEEKFEDKEVKEGEESVDSNEETTSSGPVHIISVDNGDALTARADIPERPAMENEQTWRKESRTVKRLRRLARLGKADKDEREKTDKLELYERRG